MFQAQSPTAIVWTETEGARPIHICDHLPAAIETVTSWAQREFDLSRIRELGENWDGFGGPAPDPTVLERARSFLRFLYERDVTNPPDEIVLSPSGSIGLEWLEGNSFLRAEIGDSDEVEWMLAIPGRPTEFRAESLVRPDSQALEWQEWKPEPLRIESLIQSASGAVEWQEWKPAPTAVGEPTYASAR